MLPANRHADHDVAHQGRHIAIANREVAGACRILEESRRPAPVELHAGDTLSHPPERCTNVHATLDLIVEGGVAAVKIGIATEISADEWRRIPVRDGAVWSSR